MYVWFPIRLDETPGGAAAIDSLAIPEWEITSFSEEEEEDETAVLTSSLR